MGSIPLTDLPTPLLESILANVNEDEDISRCRLTNSALRGLLWRTFQALHLHGPADVGRASEALPLDSCEAVRTLDCTIWQSSDVGALQRLLRAASEHWQLFSSASVVINCPAAPAVLSTTTWPPSVTQLTLAFTSNATSSTSTSSTSRTLCATASSGASILLAPHCGIATNLVSLDLTLGALPPAAPTATPAVPEAAAAQPATGSPAAPQAAAAGPSSSKSAATHTSSMSAAAAAAPASAGSAATADAAVPESAPAAAAAAYDLSPLAALTSLKRLRLSAKGGSISPTLFLPPALTYLSIGSTGCGSGWVAPLEQGCCTQLLELHLNGLCTTDLFASPNDPNLDFLSALTGLTALTGHLVDFPLLCFCIPSQLTSLEVVSLSSPVLEGCGVREPATYLSPNQLESCAASMQVLATWWEPEDGVPSVPLQRLTDFTLKFTSFFQEFAPMLLVPDRLPVLQTLALQPSYAALGLHLLLPFAGLTHLSLCMFSCSSLEGFEVESLKDHPSLAHLTFQGLTWEMFNSHQEKFTLLVTAAPKLHTLRFADNYFAPERAAEQLAQLRAAAAPGRQVLCEGQVKLPGIGGSDSSSSSSGSSSAAGGIDAAAGGPAAAAGPAGGLPPTAAFGGVGGDDKEESESDEMEFDLFD